MGSGATGVSGITSGADSLSVSNRPGRVQRDSLTLHRGVVPGRVGRGPTAAKVGCLQEDKEPISPCGRIGSCSFTGLA